MKSHLRANCLLLILIFSVACVLYPTVIWLYANWLFPEAAAGSLIKGKSADGASDVIRGSRLIAQPFLRDYYFQPRPSAASYNATASGGSNWGASNPKLRDRVARQLGPIVKYSANRSRHDASVQKDIEAWFADDAPAPGQLSLVVRWATDNPTLAAAWMKSDANRLAAIDWLRAHSVILDDWRQENPDAPAVDLDNPDTIPFDDIEVGFFKSIAATAAFKNRWPESADFETGEKNDQGAPVKVKRFKPISAGADLQATFFDLWLQAHPDVGLERVPADMVMASGSGLDPHITVRNASYQLDRVVTARAEAAKRDPLQVRGTVQAIVKRHSFTPLSGLVGEPLVSVLELNLALDKEIPLPSAPPNVP